MYKNIKTIDKKTIIDLNISAFDKYNWVDNTLKNKQNYILPTKTRIPLNNSDYFNVMPCVLPDENVLGLKVVTRNERRREKGEENIDGDILLYSYEDFLPLALIDGSYITTIRTAAVAVHSMINFTNYKEYNDYSFKISMIGLGHIGTEIGNILFDLINERKIIVKLYQYKDQAEKFIQKFEKYKNIQFVLCKTYDELMKDSDVIFSSVTFIEDDFCDPKCYKKNCTIIPVHLRGFKECDKVFDNIITSDMISIQKFEHYREFKKLIYIDDIIKNRNMNITDCLNTSGKIIYNLGLAVYDLYFANKIYHLVTDYER